MNGYFREDYTSFVVRPRIGKTANYYDAVFFFAKGKIVDVLNLKDCNEAVFRHWIETETQAPEELITK